jgi:hypothetical protein
MNVKYLRLFEYSWLAQGKIFFATPYIVTLKAVSVYVTKTSKGRRNISPLVLNLGTIWRPVVKITLRPFYPQVGTPVPIQYRLNWRVVGFIDVRGALEKENFLVPAGIQTPEIPVHSLVTVPTTEQQIVIWDEYFLRC